MSRKLDAGIFVAGHNGMVGSAIVRRLQELGYTNIVTKVRSELDLLDQSAVRLFFQQEHIEQIYLAAAKVGGIHANNIYPAQFIYENLMIQSNVIHAAHLADINQLLFLGSSCIYPKYAQQPITEVSMLTGELEPTNQPYAIAKIAGLKLCESYNRQYARDYRTVMPTNLYGPGDNFHLENSHVVPALLRRFHEAKLSNTGEVAVWGSGEQRREFLHVDDMAAACVHVMELDNSVYQAVTEPMLSHINIGTGVDCTIMELANMVIDVTGYKGKLIFAENTPDGTLRKLLDVSRLKKLNWEARITLRTGLQDTYQWFLVNQDKYRNV